MIKYTVRTVAGYFKLECDLRDFEEALRIVRTKNEQTIIKTGVLPNHESFKQRIKEELDQIKSKEVNK